MKVKDIIEILNAEVMCRDDLLEQELHTACGSDMMSDVLAFVKEQAVLLTGLVNPQVVRTAEMMDMHCIVFVRGKVPNKMAVEDAGSPIWIVTCAVDVQKDCLYVDVKGPDKLSGLKSERNPHSRLMVMARSLSSTGLSPVFCTGTSMTECSGFVVR